MAVNQTYTVTIANDDGTAVVDSSVVKSAGTEAAFSVTAPGNSQVDVDPISIPVADIVAFWIISDRAVSLEINTPADQTVTLGAGVPYWWHSSQITAIPITGMATITRLRFIRGAAGDAAVTGAFLVSE